MATQHIPQTDQLVGAQKEEETASESKKTGANKQMSKMELEQVVQISFFLVKSKLRNCGIYCPKIRRKTMLNFLPKCFCMFLGKEAQLRGRYVK